MKKVVCVVLLVLSFIPINTNARSGCCSHHGGVVGCSENGRQICADGTLSPSCICSGNNNSSSKTYQEPSYIYGCTDSSAFNYNSNATKDDGSCIAKKFGCMDVNAINYDSTANTENYSCKYKKTLVVNEAVKYATDYKENSDMMKDDKKEVVKGINGEKEVVYDAVVDKDGDIISKEKVSEKIMVVPVNQVIEVGTKEPYGGGIFTWIVSLVIVFVYTYKNKEDNLLVNKISRQNRKIKILLYILYVTLVIPVFIDIVIIIYNIVSKKLSLKTNNN